MWDFDLYELMECLKLGTVGREQWNSSRNEPEDMALEGLPAPLTLNLSNNVRVSLKPPKLWLADLSGADLSGYDLSGAFLSGANLKDANLTGTDLSGAHLIVTDLSNANLEGADLSLANLLDANLSNANLEGAKLVGTQMLRTTISDAVFERCDIHGISVWGAVGEPQKQSDLTITTSKEPIITVDDIEVGQFVYLLLNNTSIRNVLDTVTSKVVLILGRFSDDRKPVLDRLRQELRQFNFSPVLFDFDPAENLDFSDTVTLLARMARFVIVDLSDPRSVPHELSLIAKDVMVAIQPIIVTGQESWSMFGDLQRRSQGLLPVHEYNNAEELIEGLYDNVIAPAEVKRSELIPN